MERAGTPAATDSSTDTDRRFSASQWQLIWWSFRKHKLAVTAAPVLDSPRSSKPRWRWRRRGDRTVQAIAAKHEVHPNQVSGWKRQAQDGLRELFAGGANRRQADHEASIHDLHAKIGELTVERDFLARGLKR